MAKNDISASLSASSSSATGAMKFGDVRISGRQSALPYIVAALILVGFLAWLLWPKKKL